MQTPTEGFHGFALASVLKDASAAAALTGHGTLYKALGRMLVAGLLTSEWENPAIAEAAHRPRRKLYRVTPEGAVALAQFRASASIAGTQPAKAARGLA